MGRKPTGRQDMNRLEIKLSDEDYDLLIKLEESKKYGESKKDVIVLALRELEKGETKPKRKPSTRKPRAERPAQEKSQPKPVLKLDLGNRARALEELLK